MMLGDHANLVFLFHLVYLEHLAILVCQIVRVPQEILDAQVDQFLPVR